MYPCYFCCQLSEYISLHSNFLFVLLAQVRGSSTIAVAVAYAVVAYAVVAVAVLAVAPVVAPVLAVAIIAVAVVADR